ncbi:MAG: DinB family protein, partial [Candidatus Zixiibacteriota bacterium]
EGGKNSIGDLLRHISGAERWWFDAVITGGSFGKDLPRDEAPAADIIVRKLNESHRLVVQVLKRETIDDWEKKSFKVPIRDEVLTLREITWHVAEHEMRHRGQIFMMMRLQGITPPNV